MEDGNVSIKHFTDLRAWQEAKTLAVMVYKATEKFPAAEQFGLTSQMRRAAVSVSANIAEGFARRTGKDKRGFYQTALASLSELESHFLIAQELGFVTKESLLLLKNRMDSSGRLLTGLLRSASDRT